MFRQMWNDFKENVVALFGVSFWVVFIVVLLLITTLGSLALVPTFHNLWIKGFRSSNEYVTTKQTLLYNLVDEYNELEVEIQELQNVENSGNIISAKKGQQEALYNRIKNESRLLQEDQVPYEIKRFLSSH